eukprot:m.146852 g.146852  ORF g.146852 m.146852 type:complete len:86 (-) comp16096_c1_seq2:1681-1938(-)
MAHSDSDFGPFCSDGRTSIRSAARSSTPCHLYHYFSGHAGEFVGKKKEGEKENQNNKACPRRLTMTDIIVSLVSFALNSALAPRV